MTWQKVNYVFPYAYNFMVRYKDMHKITSANVQMGNFASARLFFGYFLIYSFNQMTNGW